MKLYEVNQAIEDIFSRIVDEETGEILSDSEELMAQLDALQMERSRILEYLAKLVLNIRAEESALKDEEDRLKARRERLGKQESRLMDILDRECDGVKTDLGIATFSYRKTERIDITDSEAATDWLRSSGHEDCYRIPAPEIIKSEVKKLIAAGEDVPGAALVSGYSCILK
ncbi:MAG: siphovirus Gp157 family protein [Clostridiales bacterium]|nr:siphovirus Gp157 family protein [Clostridiales bacterium]